MNKTQITELVCTRLSHDIIGNVGAVANAVELLEEGDLDFLDDIKAILKTSSKTLAARLKFFRLAFGLNNANLEDENFVKQIVADYLQTVGNKDFPINVELITQTPAGRKKALPLIMLAADILIRGGNIRITEENTHLTALIDAQAKLSADKLDKIEQAAANASEIADAALAPLSVLLGNGYKFSCCRTDENIIFTVE